MQVLPEYRLYHGASECVKLRSSWYVCKPFATAADRKLEAGIHEKKDAAELVLDGHLLGENPQEVNLAELLHLAQREFKDVKTIDEIDLEQGWPQLRAKLDKAYLNWKGELLKTQDEIVRKFPLWRLKFRHQILNSSAWGVTSIV
jgi:hypothetical protein